VGLKTSTLALAEAEMDVPMDDGVLFKLNP